jgi:tRNA nucleotidyltransferase (CCA-adding enzyme)
MTPKFYLVGGAVRDQLLGLTPKDKDFAVEAESYAAMKQAIVDRGGKIFLEKPEFLTIRANIPELGATDYVLCRKDGAYSDGRHPDTVEIGSILDDLARRDFTVNAMALSENSVLVDPHGGQDDLKVRKLRCVGNIWDRFTEDGLRILRALRFIITKDFNPDGSIHMALSDSAFFKSRLDKIPMERIQQEVLRCFKHDTALTLSHFKYYSELAGYLFTRGPMWLKPTLEEK